MTNTKKRIVIYFVLLVIIVGWVGFMVYIGGFGLSENCSKLNKAQCSNSMFCGITVGPSSCGDGWCTDDLAERCEFLFKKYGK